MEALEMIVLEVCKRQGVTRQALLSPHRQQRLVLSRWLVWHCARRFTALSLCEIGAAFKRDHGTVFYGLRSLADQESVDPGLARKVAEWAAYIEAQLAAGVPKKEAA